MDGFAQIGRTVSAAHRIAELVAATGNAPCTRGWQNGAGRNLPALQGSHAHKRLEGGTGRIQSLGNTVDERTLPIFVQAFPSIAVNTVDKQVGIIGRFGHQCQNTTGLRIYRHHRPASVAQQFAGFLLHADIQNQTQSLTADCRCGFQCTYDIALSVFLHFLITGHAMQLLFVVVFQTHFANMGGTAIEFVAVFTFQPIAIGIADAANVAENMGSQFAVGIFAEGASVHLHPFEAE